MRLLIIHPENAYFAGAERMLEYFLEELTASKRCEVAIAVAKGSRMDKALPPTLRKIYIEDHSRFSMGALWRQSSRLKEFRREFPFDLVHGWAARDWELASLTGWRCGSPAVGTLHDHPSAGFITPKRQWLMRWCTNWGLDRTICISKAIQNACVATGYHEAKLAVVHNGLPSLSEAPLPLQRSPGRLRIGFLGAFSERKGLRDLFKIVAGLTVADRESCEWHIAGNAQDEHGASLLKELQAAYESQNWWKNIYWHGWVDSPQAFIRKLDLLIVPSSEFEPFGLVLVEAGQAGVPVLATRIGGIPEIVVDGQTGWLFEPGNVNQAVEKLEQIIHSLVDLKPQMGERAIRHVENTFSAAKMIADYVGIYSTLLR